MTLVTCPTDLVKASAASVWEMLTLPERYERWTGADLLSVSPPGRAQPGQRIEFRVRELGRWWPVHFEIGRVIRQPLQCGQPNRPDALPGVAQSDVADCPLMLTHGSYHVLVRPGSDRLRLDGDTMKTDKAQNGHKKHKGRTEIGLLVLFVSSLCLLCLCVLAAHL